MLITQLLLNHMTLTRAARWVCEGISYSLVEVLDALIDFDLEGLSP